MLSRLYRVAGWFSASLSFMLSSSRTAPSNYPSKYCTRVVLSVLSNMNRREIELLPSSCAVCSQISLHMNKVLHLCPSRRNFSERVYQKKVFGLVHLIKQFVCPDYAQSWALLWHIFPPLEVDARENNCRVLIGSRQRSQTGLSPVRFPLAY